MMLPPFPGAIGALVAEERPNTDDGIFFDGLTIAGRAVFAGCLSFPVNADCEDIDRESSFDIIFSIDTGSSISSCSIIIEGEEISSDTNNLDSCNIPDR